MLAFGKKQKIFIFVYPIVHIILYGVSLLMYLSSWKPFAGGEGTTLTSQAGEIGTIIFFPLGFLNQSGYVAGWVAFFEILLTGFLYGLILTLIHKMISRK